MDRVMVAMSGGVDSSAAACILKENGYDCVGVTMKLFANNDIGVSREHSCCSLDDVEDARSVAYSLDIPYHVFNFSERFRETVIDRFVTAYESGITPNPCIDCNRYLKFSKLFQRADELDCKYIATGHYARIEYDERTDRYLLKKAVYADKDQSYVLYNMTQDQLARTIFPLGEMTKDEVRSVAAAHGFVNADKPESQDICFVQTGNYADFIHEYTGKEYPEGDFISTSGKVLGKHRGIIHYTIGQRKGLGLALPAPMYVCEVNPTDNTVILGSNEELFTKVLIAGDVNFISTEDFSHPVRVKAKIRYRQPEQWASAVRDGDNLIIEFDTPQRAITKGQAVVLYDGDTVVAGGIIISAPRD